MFDVARNKVNLYDDTKSITNRVRLLLLTDPTELYMNPTFGVGLRKYMFTYPNDNTVALIKDKLVEQLRLWEPEVLPDETVVERGLIYTEDGATPDPTDLNKLKLTVTLKTIYMQTISFGVSQQDFSRFI